IDVLELLRAEFADLAAANEELLTSGRLPFAFAGSSPLRHRGHHSLLSGLGAAAGPISPGTCAGTGAGRGGRRTAFRLSRSAIFAARFNSSSARTARCRRTWSDSLSRRSVSEMMAGSALTWK